MACRRVSLCLAKALRVSKVILETDNQNAAMELTKEDKDRSSHGPLIEDIKSILGSFDDFKVLEIRRTANEAAHLMVKEGCMNKVCNVSRRVPPSVIVNRLSLDLE